METLTEAVMLSLGRTNGLLEFILYWQVYCPASDNDTLLIMYISVDECRV